MLEALLAATATSGLVVLARGQFRPGINGRAGIGGNHSARVPEPDEDLPCPWCYAPTESDDHRCPGCGRRFG